MIRSRPAIFSVLALLLIWAVTGPASVSALAQNQSDMDYIGARAEALRKGDVGVGDAQALLRTRIAAMHARLDAIDAGLRTEAKTRDSHPQEVLDLVAAATADMREHILLGRQTGSSSAMGSDGRVSERLRHKDRAITSPQALRQQVQALEKKNSKKRKDKKKGRQAVAGMELEADRLEMAIVRLEAGLILLRKKPGRTTWSDMR